MLLLDWIPYKLNGWDMLYIDVILIYIIYLNDVILL